MIKISSVMILMTIVRVTWETCSKGTLSCSTKDSISSPLICDFPNNFILDPTSSECVEQKLDGCLMTSFTGDNLCFVCENNKIVDLSTHKCVDVPPKDRIAKCLRYSMDSKQCQLCQEGYFISYGRCVALPEGNHENCFKQASSSSCAICETGFYLEEGVCKEIPDESNCSVFTKYQCRECEQSHFLDRGHNPQLDIHNKLEEISNQILNNFGVILNPDKNVNSVCLETTVQNCSTFNEFDSCSKCEENFFLTTQGKCQRFPEEPLPNCSEYTDMNTCSKCSNGFYFTAPNECVSSTEVPECKEYSGEEDKCIECNQNFWLDDPNQTCTERVNLVIEHCLKNNTTSDQCSECTSIFSLTQDGLACLMNIEHCQTQNQAIDKNTQEHTCVECSSGYFEQANSCKPQSISHCAEYVPNFNQCQKCEENFFHFPDRSVCAEQSIAHCSEYSQDSTNTCLHCHNLKYLNPERTSCLDIDNFQNCFLSDGLVNVCIECLPGFFLQGSTCTGQRSFEVFDENCLSNKHTFLTSSCTRCGDNHAPLIGTFPAVAEDFFTENPTCLQIHPLTGECNQCSDFHQLTSSRTCTQVPDSDALVCKRIISGQMQLLEENIFCEECKDPLSQFLSQGRCQNRSEYTNYSGCASSIENTDSHCWGCESDLYTVPINLLPQCVDPLISNLFEEISIPNCLIRDGKSKCFICQPGTYLTSDNMSCVSLDPENNATLWNAFDDQMQPIGSIQSQQDLLENCEEYGQVHGGKIACVKCKTGFIGILSRDSSSRTQAMEISISVNGRSNTMEFWNTFIECYDASLILRTDSSTQHVGSSDCEFGFRIPEREGYGCLKCKDNKIGQILDVQYDADGIYLHTNYQVIGQCQTSLLKSELTSIGFPNRDNLAHIQWNILMPYTNCGTWGYADNQVLVYMFLTDFLNPYITLTAFLDHSTVVPQQGLQAYCLPSARVQNQISNCQIYGLSTLIPSFDSSTSVISDPVCLACEPGFSPVFDITGAEITSCQAISECTTNSHASNTWLNACESPTHNAWNQEILSGTQVVAFDDPVSSADAIADCLVIDSSPTVSVCLMCRVGYTLFDNSCVFIPQGEFLCENIGMGFTNVSDSLVALRSLHFNSFAHLRFHSDNSGFLDHVHPLCNSCMNDQILFIDSQNNNSKICGQSMFINSSDHIPSNCKYTAFDQPLKCAECDSNYLLARPSLECVPQSSFPNCSTLLSSNGSFSCTSCTKGFFLSSGSCLPTNCLAFSGTDPSQCAICNENYKIDPTTTQRCILNTQSSAPCLLFSPTLNHCIACSDPEKMVHLFVDVGNSSQILGYECSPFEVKGNGMDDYNLTYPFIRIEISSDNGIETHLERVETEDQIKRTFSNKSPMKSPADSHCLPKRVVLQCDEHSLEDNVYCRKCKDFYSLRTSDNQCIPGLISSCRKYLDDSAGCTECLKEYFLSSDRQSCLARLNTQNCEEFKADEDKCTKCKTGHWLNLNDFSCQEYSARFCKEFHPNLNQCQTCQEDTWKENIQGNVICKAYSARNCATHNPERDECLSCNDKGFPVTHTDGSLLCSDRTILNCEQVDPNEDDCLLCQEGSYYNTNTQNCIVHRSMPNCQTFSRTSAECQQCNPGFYFSTNLQDCQEYPKGILGCVDYVSEDQCSQCRKEYFPEGGRCSLQETPISGCARYTSATSCAECESGRVLVGNECKSTSLSNCLTFENETACSICSPNYILNSDTKQCEDSGITNCISAQKGDPNICTKCRSRYVLSFDKTACSFPLVDIKNCLEYSDQTTCEICEPGYLLSQAKDKCSPIQDLAGSNCAFGEELSTPVCDVCSLGFEKEASGNCVAFKTSNCWVWDYQQDRCQLCQSGTYMDSSYKCIQIIIEDQSQKNCLITSYMFMFLLSFLFITLKFN